jgi:light-regulated signal transduction histidine kinase (bacteriophytochrome)
VCADNLYHGAQILVERLNAIVLGDRALCYRMWLPDFHPEVIAEQRKVGDLYPFLGLKFPPQCAEERAKYVEVRTRLISDTTSFPSTVIGSFDPDLRPMTVSTHDGGTTTIFTSDKGNKESRAAASASAVSSRGGSYTLSEAETVKEKEEQEKRFEDEQASCASYALNFSHSLVRAPTVSYLNLLRSLGIRSSLSFSIVLGRQLRGVLAFYSVTQPRLICWEHLQFVRAAVAMFAQWMHAQENLMQSLQEDQLREMSRRMRHSLESCLQTEPSELLALLLFGHPDLCEIAGADSFAMVCGKEWLRVGALPPQSWLAEFADWFIAEAEDQRSSTRIPDWKVQKGTREQYTTPSRTGSVRRQRGLMEVSVLVSCSVCFVCRCLHRRPCQCGLR